MTTYYVAINGSSNSSGTSISSPRNTVPSSLSAGDTVYFRAGTYNFAITASNSGSSGNVITYAAYNNERVVIRGSGNSIFTIGGKNYITISGLTFTLHTTTPSNKQAVWVTLTGTCSNITIDNCTLRKTVDPYTDYRRGYREHSIQVNSSCSTVTIQNCLIEGMNKGIQLKGACQDVHIKGNVIRNCAQSCIVLNSSGSTERGALIENNILEGSVIEDGIQFMPDYDAANIETDVSNQGHLIRNNVIRHNAENAIDFKGARYCVVEGNFIYGTIGSNDGDYSAWNRESLNAIGRGSRTDSKDIIVRNNVIYDNANGMWIDGDNTKVYGNVIIYNRRDYTGSPSTKGGTGSHPWFYGWRNRFTGNSDIGIKNNIVGGHGPHGQTALRITSSNTLDIDGNLYFAGTNGASYILNWKGSSFDRYSFSAWKTFLNGLGYVSGKDANSVWVSDHSDVGFVDVPAYPKDAPENYDFNVTTSSGAYQTGVALTTTTSSGSSTTSVPVDDATWFFDGYGSNLYSGDTIMVDGNEVTITGISSNTLTVTPAITFTNTADVYYGTSTTPNIGLPSTTAPTTPVLRAGFSLSETSGTVPLTVDVADNSLNADTYLYELSSNGGAYRQVSTASSPSITISSGGTHVLRQTVTDENSNSKTFSLSISVTGAEDTEDTDGQGGDGPGGETPVIEDSQTSTQTDLIEDVPDDWTSTWTYTGSDSDVTASSGVFTVEADGTSLRQLYTTEDLTTTPRYTLIYEAKHDITGNVRKLYVGVRDSTGSTDLGLSSTDTIPVGSSYTTFTHTFSSSANETGARIRWLHSASSGTTFNIRSIQLYAQSVYPNFDLATDGSSVGSTFTLTNTTVNYEGTPTYSWEYQIDSGGWTEFSTDENAELVTSSTGSYDIRLTVDNGEDSQTVSSTGHGIQAAVSTECDGNLLTNGYFTSAGTWSVTTGAGFSVSNGVGIITADPTTFNSFYQDSISITDGDTYRLTFTARATPATDMEIVLTGNSTEVDTETVELTGVYDDYSVTLSSTETDANGRFEIVFQTPGSIELKSMCLVEVVTAGTTEAWSISGAETGAAYMGSISPAPAQAWSISGAEIGTVLSSGVTATPEQAWSVSGAEISGVVSLSRIRLEQRERDFLLSLKDTIMGNEFEVREGLQWVGLSEEVTYTVSMANSGTPSSVDSSTLYDVTDPDSIVTVGGGLSGSASVSGTSVIAPKVLGSSLSDGGRYSLDLIVTMDGGDKLLVTVPIIGTTRGK